MSDQPPDYTGIAGRLRDYVFANHRDPDCCGLARMLSEAVEAIRSAEATNESLNQTITLLMGKVQDATTALAAVEAERAEIRHAHVGALTHQRTLRSDIERYKAWLAESEAAQARLVEHGPCWTRF